VFDDMRYQKKILVCIFSFIFTILLLTSLDYILSVYMHSEISLEGIFDIFTYSAEHFQPEPIERMQYISNVVCLPVFLMFFLYFYEKKVYILSLKTIKWLYFIITFIVVSLLFSLFWFGTINSNFFFFTNSILYKSPILLSISMFVLILISYVYNKDNVFLGKNIGKVLDVTVIMFIVFLGALNVFSIYSVDDEQVYINHFSAVFHSVSMTYLNKFPLVSYVNQYGLYPQFLEPLFKIIGLTILNFTLVMAGLLIGSLFLIFLSLKKVLNRYFAFFGFITFLYNGYVFIKTVSSDPYYQYYPIRSLFPSIIIFFTVIYFLNKSKFKYYFSFVLISIAVLWNLDTGAIVFITWLVTLIYSETLEQKPFKKIVTSSIKHILVSLLSLILVVILYSFYIYFRVGVMPDFLLFFEYQKYFFGYGFFMLPMSLFHPWNMIILVYVVGLIISLYSMLNKKKSIKIIMIFMLSILGLGLFSYYQGRSHDFVLPYAWYPAFLLIPIYTEDIYYFLKRKKMELKFQVPVIIIFFSCMTLMFLSFLNIINSTKTLSYSVESRWGALLEKKETPLLSDIEFLKNQTIEKEKILILSYNSGIEYVMSSTIPAFDSPGLTEMLLKKDYDKLIAYINTRETEKIFLANNLSHINGEYNSKLIFTIFENYDFEASSKDRSMLMLKRKELVNQSSLDFKGIMNKLIHIDDSLHFKNINQTYYYDKYSNTIKNTENVGAINFDESFSIQVVLEPNEIQSSYADILGNHPGNGFDGFVIQQDGDQNNQYNFIYGNGIVWSEPLAIKLESSKTSYLVIQYNKGTVTIQLNGKEIISSNQNILYGNSHMPLTIGNWIKGDRLFNGLIDEVQVSRELISEVDINRNWISIREK
jgi:drug/metabolite transporter (DMT)-like permease